MRTILRRVAPVAAVALAGALLAGCERPPVDAVQVGFRGTGMEQVYNPRRVVEQSYLNVLPEGPTEPASPDGPKAREVYQNVKILGDLSVAQFTNVMVAMTNWVAPKEGPEAGCLYCHTNNFAEDTKYTKNVARRMTQMTWKINADWKNHVQNTGVTCYTCHRGQPVPQNVWFAPEPQKRPGGLLGEKGGQNTPAESVTLTTLPYDPFTPYLVEDKPIRVQGPTALPTGNRQSIKQTEHTYALMVHMSDGLGVNCTYCHNSRSWQSWELSPPQRTTAWYGIRMLRELNNEYMVPLTATFPPNRLGPTGDVAKANCATCHQGAYKPLYGQSMLQAHPELAAPPKSGSAAAPAGTAPAAQAPATPVAPAAAPAAPGKTSAAPVDRPLLASTSVDGTDPRSRRVEAAVR